MIFGERVRVVGEMVLPCKKGRRKKQEQRKGAGLSGAAKEDKGGSLCGARVMPREEKITLTFSTFTFVLFTLL